MGVSRSWIFSKLNQLVSQNFQIIVNYFRLFCLLSVEISTLNIALIECFLLFYDLYFYKYSVIKGRVIRTMKKHWPKLKSKYIPF